MPTDAYYLQQLDQYQAQTGTRLLDYFTLHYYPQGGEFSNDVSTATELLRNESTRSLWDPTYVDQSWIGQSDVFGGIVDLIPRMQSWVNTYYPGTKTGITEYNWGADGNMNGATTQADAWGIFGREGLDLADRWGVPATGTPTYLAMQMYRNYDGHDSTFGDTSVSTTVQNPDDVDTFSAIRSSDGALTIMIINKNLYDSSNPKATTSVTLNLSNFAGAGEAQVWQLAAINPADQANAAINQLTNMDISGGTATFTVPQESITLLIIPPASSTLPAPTGFIATAGVAQVGLAWNSVSGATSYNLYRSTTSGTETLIASGITGTSFTDTGVTNGLEYFYEVTALGPDGESPRSNEVSATPQFPAVTGFVFSGSSTTTAGTSFSETIAAVGANGETIPNYTGTIQFSSGDVSAVLPSQYTFTSADAGKHTFIFTLKTSGSQTITATDTNTGSLTVNDSIAVSAATAQSFRISGNANAIAGTSFTEALTALDAFGNIATSYRGTIHFTSTDKHAGLPVNYTYLASDLGQHTFTFTLKTAGNEFLTATSSTNGSLKGTMLIPVAPGAGSVFVLVGPTGTDVAGSVLDSVTVKDAYGNIDTDYTGTVHFTSSDRKAVLPADYTFASSDMGQQSFSITLESAGRDTVMATDTGNGSVTGNEIVEVASGAPSMFRVSGLPSAITAGTAALVTVIAEDSYGNVSQKYSGVIHFTSTDPHSSLPQIL